MPWTCGTGCRCCGRRSRRGEWLRTRPGGSPPTPARLPFEGARWVDEQLAARVDGFGLPTIERLVALAAARFAPEEQAEQEQRSRSRHHVTLTHPRPGEFAGTSWLEAAGDTAGPHRLLRPRLRGGQAPRPARGHRRLRDPQGHGPRRHRRPAGHARTERQATRPGVRCRRSSTCTSRWPTSPPTPSTESRWWVRSRSSAPPPSTSSGRGCTTRRPPSSRCWTSTAPTPSTGTTRRRGCASR